MNHHHHSQPPGDDEQDFDAFASQQDPLDIEAANWVLRHRRGLSPDEHQAWQRWLAQDPRHGDAFDDMRDTFGEVQQLPVDDVARLRSSLPPRRPPATSQPLASPPAVGRPPPQTAGLPRWWLPSLPQFGVAALVLAVAGGGAWHWWQQPLFVQHYATARGQQMQLQLPDADGQGSQLQLDTRTSLTVTLYRNRREVRLEEGQARFAVAADRQRPFTVDAGRTRVTVVGTRFSVRHTGSGLHAGQTLVAVEEGKVRVSQLGLDAQPVAAGRQPSLPLLTAGQSLLLNAQGVPGAIASVGNAAAANLAPWRTGRLSFDQTPLAVAIAEFERYGPTGLSVRDPAVATLPVGGSYSVGQWQHFADSLPQVLPVRLVRRGEVSEVVAR